MRCDSAVALSAEDATIYGGRYSEREPNLRSSIIGAWNLLRRVAVVFALVGVLVVPSSASAAAGQAHTSPPIAFVVRVTPHLFEEVPREEVSSGDYADHEYNDRVKEFNFGAIFLYIIVGAIVLGIIVFVKDLVT